MPEKDYGEEGREIYRFRALGMPKMQVARKVQDMENNLKLFVWDNYNSDYTDGLAFALAENVEEARKLVVRELGYEIADNAWGRLAIFPICKIARCVSGGS